MGDVMYLTLTHPKALAHVVKYIYTAQDELTMVIKESTVYLVGKV